MQRARNVSKPSEATKAIIKGQPAPSYATVGDSELRRYEELCNPDDKSAAAEARAQRHKISQERVAHWPNTLEAQRAKKENARKQRLEADEHRRQLIDREEEAIQQAKKEQSIHKANLLLFQENDRVKTFTSKLFLASVLEEREKQFAIQAEKKKLDEEAERHWALTEAEQLRKAREEDEIKIKEIKAREAAVKRTQLDQLDQIRQVKIKHRDEDRAEGNRIREAAIKSVEEEQEQERQRREVQRNRAAQLVHANEQLQKVKDEQLAKERAELEKIEEFAKAKESQMLQRKKRVEEKFHAKMNRRQQIIDRQAQLLSEITAAREERELKALRDFERERADREAAEEAYRQKRQKEIMDFSQAYFDRKKLHKQKEELEKERLTELLRVRAEVLIDEELAERQHEREVAQENQRILLLQAQEKKAREAREKALEYNEGIAMQNALKEEQDTFHGYVNAMMSEYVKNGRSAAQLQATLNPRSKLLKSA